MQGWIKLHRKIRNNPIFNDPQLLRLWIICLTEASHKEHEQIVGKQVIKLQPGEFVTGRFAIMEMYNNGLKDGDKIKGQSTVYRWLEFLEKAGFLNIKKNNKFSIVTIDKWGVYQENEPINEHQNEQQMNNKRTSNEQQMNTNKNVNNGNNGENGKKKNSRHKYEICDMNSAKMLFDLILVNDPTAKEPNLEQWANDIRLIRQMDKRPTEHIDWFINWTQQHHFWSANILSPSKLRKQWGTLVQQAKNEHERKNKQIAKPDKPRAFASLEEWAMEGE